MLCVLCSVAQCGRSNRGRGVPGAPGEVVAGSSGAPGGRWKVHCAFDRVPGCLSPFAWYGIGSRLALCHEGAGRSRFLAGGGGSGGAGVHSAAVGGPCFHRWQ